MCRLNQEAMGSITHSSTAQEWILGKWIVPPESSGNLCWRTCSFSSLCGIRSSLCYSHSCSGGCHDNLHYCFTDHLCGGVHSHSCFRCGIDINTASICFCPGQGGDMLRLQLRCHHTCTATCRGLLCSALAEAKPSQGNQGQTKSETSILWRGADKGRNDSVKGGSWEGEERTNSQKGGWMKKEGIFSSSGWQHWAGDIIPSKRHHAHGATSSSKCHRPR